MFNGLLISYLMSVEVLEDDDSSSEQQVDKVQVTGGVEPFTNYEGGSVLGVEEVIGPRVETVERVGQHIYHDIGLVMICE